jgi:outer membrane usher protein
MRNAHRTAPAICATLLALCSAAAAWADDAGDLGSGWRESVLELTVNGVAAGENFVVLRDPGGGLWVAEADFTRLRLHVPRATPHVSDGRRYFPLAAITGTKVAFDDSRSAASITAPGTAFDTTNVSFIGSGSRPPLSRSGSGVFLNYILYGQTGQYTGADLASAYTELGIFSPAGVLTSTAVETDNQGAHSFVRFETTLTHDFPDSLETLRLGDTISVPGSWAEAVRFAGLQWGSNYGIRPDLVTTPLLAATGTAVVPSTVDVFVNGKAVGSSEVPAGPFIVNQVPALTGAGDVSIVVRNALGQEQIVSLPFYSAAVMLQPGLSLYDIDVGAVRENYGVSSDDYGPLLATATWRRGMTASLTGEIHAEALRDGPQAAGIDLAQAIDDWAVVTLDLAAGGQPAGFVIPGGAAAQPATSGTYSAIGIQHVDPRFSVVLQAQHASSGFRDIGDLSTVATPLDRDVAQAGWNLSSHAGSLQVAFVAQRNANDTRQQTLGVSYQVNIGRGSFGVSANRTTGDTDDTSAYLFYSLTLGERRNSSTAVRYDSQQPSSRVALVETLQKSPPLGAGDGYLLSAGTDGSYNAEYTRQTDVGTLQVQAARNLDMSAESLTASGGLTVFDGELRATRTVTDSFAMVDVGGIPGVTVYFDNQPVARTDDNGLALVPNLRSFDVNRFSIDPLQLPLDATVTDTQLQTVPPYRSGTVVRFPVERVRAGVFKLQLADGSAVPPGAVVTFVGQDFPVGLEGLAYLTNYDHGATGEAHWNGGRCTFRLPPPPSGEPQPDLGTIVCRSIP